MKEAIHKLTKQRISAWRLTHDLEWQGKERDEFIAPFEYIENWSELRKNKINEVIVSFVKKHKRYTGTEKEEEVSEHFRIETDGAIEDRWANESEEHKLAKKYIYNNIENLKINGTLLKDIEIQDVRIERGVGNKRADVLVMFKNWHQIYGLGISFEIQISPQSDYETIERSYDRACYGYSTCWIWDKELEDLDIEKDYIVTPYANALKIFLHEENKKQDNRFVEIAKKIKLLSNELQIELNNQIRPILQNFETQKINMISLNKSNYEIYNTVMKLRSDVVGEIKNEIDKSKKVLQDEVETQKINIVNDIKNKLSEQIIKEVGTLNINELIKDYVQSNVRKEINKDNLPCPNCNSTNTHEYLDCYLCFDCKRNIGKQGYYEINRGKIDGAKG